MILTLERTYHPNATTGLLYAGDWSTETLECPWRNNEIGVSCIPEGVYTLHRDLYGRHRYFRLEDAEVAPRSAIEIHSVEPVCFATHLQGCICPGELFWETLEPWPVPHIEGSKHACDTLVSLLKDSDSHTLVIRQWRPRGMARQRPEMAA